MKTIKEIFVAAVVLGGVGVAGSYANEILQQTPFAPELENKHYTQSDVVTCQQKAATNHATADQNDPRYLRENTASVIKCLNDRNDYAISWNFSR